MIQFLLKQKSFFICSFLLLTFFHPALAQVGINTTTPAGILDVNSTVQGVVLPRIALTATNLQAPVVNPQGGSIVAGTVIYNTNTTTSANGVSPGIYMWNGSKWINQFQKKDYVVKQQTLPNYVPASSTQTINNMGNLTFTPKYTGTYKIEVNANFGTGYIKNPTTGTINAATQRGQFQLVFGGVTNSIPVYSYGASTNGTRFYLIWQETTYTKYVNLTAGVTYSNISLSFAHGNNVGSAFETGNSGGTDGRCYIGYDIPCSIEFIYVGD